MRPRTPRHTGETTAKTFGDIEDRSPLAVSVVSWSSAGDPVFMRAGPPAEASQLVLCRVRLAGRLVHHVGRSPGHDRRDAVPTA
jgi:hypothetical protein